MVQFTHLHTHTPEGSLLDGFMRIDKAIEKAKRVGMDSIGVSEHGTMSSHKLFNDKMKAAGLHPVFGMEAYQTVDKSFRKEDFEGVHYVEGEDGHLVFDLLEIGSVDEDEWTLISDIRPVKEMKRIELKSKIPGAYMYNLVEESLPPGDEMPKGRAAITRRVNAMLKEYRKRGLDLYVKADTAQKRYFEWFPQIGHLLLIAKNNEGYQNLLTLNAIGFKGGFYGKPRIDYSDLEKYGKGLAATTACFLEDAPVYTTNGVKKISEVEIGDKVVSHKGNVKKVEYKTTRPFSDKMNNITTKGSTLDITATNDHKFLVFEENNDYMTESTKERRRLTREYFKGTMKPGGEKTKAKNFVPYGTSKWIEAKDIKKGDLLLTAIDNRIDEINNIDITSFKENSSTYNLKNYNLTITNDLIELLGIYAAEGSVNKGRTTFSVDSRDTQLINFITNTMEETFGITSRLYDKKDSKGLDITYHSIELVNLFKDWFDTGAPNKKMPYFLRYLEPSRQMLFVKGLLYCDGHSRVGKEGLLMGEKHIRKEITISTTSKSMVSDISHILHRNNINPFITTNPERVDRKGVNHREYYAINIYRKLAVDIHNFVFEEEDFSEDLLNNRSIHDYPILIDETKYMRQKVVKNESEKYSGNVYCLNVEDDHSFNAFGASVHNCLGGFVPQLILRGRIDEAREEILKTKDYFDEYFLEIQPSHQEDQHLVNEQLIKFSEELDIPLIATSDVHMVDKDELELHEQITNIGMGGAADASDLDSDISFYGSAYMMTPQEILDHGIPRQALQNAYDLSHRCQVDFLEDEELKFPEYEVPEEHTFDSYLRKKVNKGLFELFLTKDYIKDYDKYHARIEYELDIIKQKGYSAYFLIVQDYMNWAREAGIMTGPGRGN